MGLFSIPELNKKFILVCNISGDIIQGYKGISQWTIKLRYVYIVIFFRRKKNGGKVWTLLVESSQQMREG